MQTNTLVSALTQAHHFFLRALRKNRKDKIIEKVDMGIVQDMTDSMEDMPTSQDAKTLVPMSLSLYVKTRGCLYQTLDQLT